MLGRLHQGDDPNSTRPADPDAEVRVTEANESKGERTVRSGQPARLALPRAVIEKVLEAGIYCQPRVSMVYQKAAKRHLLRGVESGGAVREFGHYVAFCDKEGRALAWLQPLQSIGANGPHAVVIAPALVSVEMFRVEQTYELLIAEHEPRLGAGEAAPKLWSQVVFRGRQGYLSLELWGRDREAAGQITPEFFTAAGDRKEIPAKFVAAVRAVTKGVTAVGCDQAQYTHAPAVITEETTPDGGLEEESLKVAVAG
jgi:hypothetical protein